MVVSEHGSRKVHLSDGTIKTRYVHIDLGNNPKTCYKCGYPIGFHELKSGKWIPVTAQHSKQGGWEIVVNRGNYGNYTPIHKCNKR